MTCRQEYGMGSPTGPGSGAWPVPSGLRSSTGAGAGTVNPPRIRHGARAAGAAPTGVTAWPVGGGAGPRLVEEGTPVPAVVLAGVRVPGRGDDGVPVVALDDLDVGAEDGGIAARWYPEEQDPAVDRALLAAAGGRAPCFRQRP